MILEKTRSYILRLDKSKLGDYSYHNYHFHKNKYQYPHFRRDQNMYLECIIQKKTFKT